MEKRTVARIFSLAAALFSLVSCTGEWTGASGPNGGVVFSASVGEEGAVTRMTGNVWEQGDAIGIFMLSDGGTIPAGIISPGGRAADNRRYVYSGGYFSPADPGEKLHYPEGGEAVGFAAYYPYKATGTEGVDNYVYPIDLTDQSDPAAIDLLYAPANGINGNSRIVPLIFTHRLSKLVLTVTKGGGMDAADFSGLTATLRGAPAVAGFSLSDLSFSDISSADVTARTVTPGAEYELILIPHEGINGRSVEFRADSDTFVWDIPQTASFECGKRHVWTITISKSGISASPGNIARWGGIDAPPITGSTGSSSIKFKVGDYWPDPEAVYIGGVLQSGQKAEGVVFWLDPDAEGYDGAADPENPVGLHGKIVGLNQASGLSWGIGNTDESLDIEGIRSDDDGCTATNNLIAMRSGSSSFASSYPAFNWIYQQNGGRQGPWYLPAKNELMLLRNMWNGGAGAGAIDRPAFNAILSSAGGTELTRNVYWSSTELSASVAITIGFDNGAVNIFLLKSNFPGYVRAIRKF